MPNKAYGAWFEGRITNELILGACKQPTNETTRLLSSLDNYVWGFSSTSKRLAGSLTPFPPPRKRLPSSLQEAYGKPHPPPGAKETIKYIFLRTPIIDFHNSKNELVKMKSETL